ncbi:MarR family winged helix-turn-helix transcriptional regulator [Aliisedimentitalea scapharcae]|uniref:MarR family winged helix-turn-helix transcriptional regulator n=1 Tax=Aliisedimentitalea scapharcae TaxID=1524259 RepID=A0ABZ2XYC4_9RHOB|nr:MarR family transcriptional regulator [Rhodobacteraceae bacterium M382]
MSDFAKLEAAWIALNRAQKQVYQRIERALLNAGLPRLNWYDVLWELELSPEGLRPFQLEERLLFDQSSFSRQVARMTQEGLIEQRPAQEDRRGKLLILTPKGRALRAQMWEVYRPMIDTGMAELIANGGLDGIAPVQNPHRDA